MNKVYRRQFKVKSQNLGIPLCQTLGHEKTSGWRSNDRSAGNASVFSLRWPFKDSGNTVGNPEAAIAKYSPAGARQSVNFLAGTGGTT
jgi:hypothetical protein